MSKPRKLDRDRLVQWLLSERFKCDQSNVTMREAAEEIATMLCDGGTFEEDANRLGWNEREG